VGIGGEVDHVVSPGFFLSGGRGRVRARGLANIPAVFLTYEANFLTYETYEFGFFTYHGFMTITTSSRIISLD
jgi:hypothetical protein